MYGLIFLPFFIQAAAIFIDEYYFHIKRGLPKWERIGHPIDTFSVLICFIFAAVFPFNALYLKLYILLAAISCLMVTKDEFVHKHHCPASENWLHALLFINHPIVLSITGIMWWQFSSETVPQWLSSWFSNPLFFRLFLWSQIGFISLFLIYQIIYWNFLWKEKNIKSFP